MNTPGTSHELQTSQWQASNNPKKKKREETDTVQIRRVKAKVDNQPKIGTQPILTQNRFQALSDTTEGEQVEETEAKVPKPPPIFIADVIDIQPLIKLLDEEVKDNYFLKTIANKQVKVQPTYVESYKKIVSRLTNDKIQFHTYQLKQNRAYRVFIKNLHHTTDINNLKVEIEAKGHKVINIYNVKHRVGKYPLPMFIIELEQNLNNKSIYEIQYLQYTKVIIEPPRPKKEITQCARCQRYGHTKTYCTRLERCVKCSGNHATRNCNKDETTPVKCVLCDGNHPANYKGCTVYKEIYQRKYPPLRQRNTTNSPQKVNPNITYAQITTNNVNNKDIPNTQANRNELLTSNSKLEEMMINLMGKMDTILNLLTTLITKLP